MMGLVIKIFRFCVTGGLGFCIDFGLTYLCKERFRLNKYLSNAIGFSMAVTNNYIINRIWTFQSADPHVIRQFSLFIIVSLTGLVLNLSFLYYFHEKRARHFYISKLFSVALVFIWNFTINYFLTFGHG